MSDPHHLPLLGRDLPDWAASSRVRARVHFVKGLWLWEHQCLNRLPDKPWHGLPEMTLTMAYRVAETHVRYCV